VAGQTQRSGRAPPAEIYYEQFDALRSLRQQVRRELLAESAKHKASKLLCQIPSIGPIRAAQLIAILQTPHRFAARDNCGPTEVCHRNAQQRRSSVCERATATSKRQVSLRGLNRNHNHELKNIFKGAAIIAATKPGPLQNFTPLWWPRNAAGMARLTLARKIAAIILIVWKKGVSFDAEHLNHKQLECLWSPLHPWKISRAVVSRFLRRSGSRASLH